MHNIFISWSGTRSKKIAESLKIFLTHVIQLANPWISSEDLKKGALWFAEISNQLSNNRIGIICLTAENLKNPWILFEAGALANGLGGREKVLPLLIDIQNKTDVPAPLGNFNLTSFDKEDMWLLIKTVNDNILENPMKESIIKHSFDTNWDSFKTQYQNILNEDLSKGNVVKRTTEDMISEVLSTVRSLDQKITDGSPKSMKNINLDLTLVTRKALAPLLDAGRSNNEIKQILIQEGFPIEIIEVSLLHEIIWRTVPRKTKE